MASRHVTTRVPAELFEEIERIQTAERTDRSTAIKRLLERGVEDWRVETAVDRYRDGEVSVGKAAELAGLSLWRFLDVLAERGVETNYTEADLDDDLAAVRDDE